LLTSSLAVKVVPVSQVDDWLV